MRTQFARATLLPVCLALTSCAHSGSGGASDRAIPALPAAAAQPCARPGDALSAGDWRPIAGRLGDALIDCEARRALAAGSYGDLRRAMGGW